MNQNPNIDTLLQTLSAENADATQLQDLMADQEGFSEGFADRVTHAAFAAQKDNVTDHLGKAFRWVALVGAAAAVALLILTWTANDALTTDDLAGISALSIADPIIENF